MNTSRDTWKKKKEEGALACSTPFCQVQVLLIITEVQRDWVSCPKPHSDCSTVGGRTLGSSLTLWSQFCFKVAAPGGQWGGAREGGVASSKWKLTGCGHSLWLGVTRILEGQASTGQLSWHLSFCLCVSLQHALAGGQTFPLKGPWIGIIPKGFDLPVSVFKGRHLTCVPKRSLCVWLVYLLCAVTNSHHRDRYLTHSFYICIFKGLLTGTHAFKQNPWENVGFCVGMR